MLIGDPASSRCLHVRVIPLINPNKTKGYPTCKPKHDLLVVEIFPTQELTATIPVQPYTVTPTLRHQWQRHFALAIPICIQIGGNSGRDSLVLLSQL